jgi:hypothetical protein
MPIQVWLFSISRFSKSSFSIEKDLDQGAGSPSSLSIEKKSVSEVQMKSLFKKYFTNVKPNRFLLSI